jgi:hypothetical protein
MGVAYEYERAMNRAGVEGKVGKIKFLCLFSIFIISLLLALIVLTFWILFMLSPRLGQLPRGRTMTGAGRHDRAPAPMASIIRMTRSLLGEASRTRLVARPLFPHFSFINYDKQAPLFGSVSRGTYCVHIFTAN